MCCQPVLLNSVSGTKIWVIHSKGSDLNKCCCSTFSACNGHQLYQRQQGRKY